ncbi:hypothetical protein BJX96DRAFT_171613 [Aspergillus floccosus]
MYVSSIILGKQWKSEGDETKLHFRNLAEELKKKHAEDHPDYHYSPRKPSEKKRRASSRQSKLSRNESSPSTNGPSNVSTPVMYPDMSMGDSTITGTTFGGIFTAGDGEFDPETFDTLLQQVQSDHHHNKNATMYQFSYPDIPLGDSFEFSEFVSDCF